MKLFFWGVAFASFFFFYFFLPHRRGFYVLFLLEFCHPHIILAVASGRPFVCQAFPPFNPDLSFAAGRRSGAVWRGAGSEKELAEPGAQLLPCCVWMLGKKNAVWVWKNHFGHLLVSIKVYRSV